MLFLSVPVLTCLLGIQVTLFTFVMGGSSGFMYIPLVVNCVIALFSAYGFLLKNKKMALFTGITTLYSILIAISPFFTTASDPVEGLTGRDYMNDFHFSLIFDLVVCLIVSIILVLILLIRKNHHSAMSLLENGGILTKAKIEILVVVICNIALIVTTYIGVLQEGTLLYN